MSCKLTESAKMAVDFEGTPGQSAKLSIRTTGDPGSAELDFIRYNGQTITSDPAVVPIVAGQKPLIVGLRGTVDGQSCQLVEVCDDGTETKLRRYKYSALSPSRTLVLEGK